MFEDNGGSDNTITSRGPSYDGEYTLRIRDNSGTSWAATSPIDVSSYSSLELGFYFLTRNVVSGQYFVVSYSTNKGALWGELEVFQFGEGIWTENNLWVSASVPAVNVQGANEIQFRLQTAFASNTQRLHVDEIVLKGLAA